MHAAQCQYYLLLSRLSNSAFPYLMVDLVRSVLGLGPGVLGSIPYLDATCLSLLLGSGCKI